MKTFYSLTLAAAGFMLLFSACGNSYDSATANLSSQNDSLSYSFGFLQGSSLAAEGIDDIDMNNYIAGLQTAFDHADAEIDQMAMQTLIQTYFQELQMRQYEEQSEQAEVNKEQGRAFLEENLQNSDVSETESGLQYRVIEEGSGEKPQATDEVQVNYRGTLLNEQEFDSSPEPITFPLNRVIPGWTEGVQLMNVGSTYQFFIPSELAYGDNPPPGSIIEPGSVLIFEVELLDIVTE